MNKNIFIAGIAAAFMGASPASAALIVCAAQNCGTTTENLLFNTGVQTATTVFGTTNAGTAVTVVGTNTLVAQGGQSSVTGTSGVLTGGLNFFLTNGGSFTAFEFNLEGVPGNPPPAEASSVTFTITGANGVLTTTSPYPLYALSGNGNNWFSGYTTGGDVITDIAFTLNPTGAAVDSLKQVRLGGVSQVPEPATWSMMILGLGLIGAAARRRRGSIPAFS